MAYNTDKSKQEEILYLLNSKYAELDLMNNLVGNEDETFFADPNDPAFISFYTLAGTPFSREMNKHFQEVLERKDLRVIRDETCMYSRREEHRYIVRIKSSGK